MRKIDPRRLANRIVKELPIAFGYGCCGWFPLHADGNDVTSAMTAFRNLNLRCVENLPARTFTTNHAWLQTCSVLIDDMDALIMERMKQLWEANDQNQLPGWKKWACFRSIAIARAKEIISALRTGADPPSETLSLVIQDVCAVLGFGQFAFAMKPGDDLQPVEASAITKGAIIRQALLGRWSNPVVDEFFNAASKGATEFETEDPEALETVLQTIKEELRLTVAMASYSWVSPNTENLQPAFLNVQDVFNRLLRAVRISVAQVAH